MRIAKLASALVVVVGVALACSSDKKSGSKETCVPMTTEVCMGTTCTRTCLSDGSGWTACQCGTTSSATNGSGPTTTAAGGSGSGGDGAGGNPFGGTGGDGGTGGQAGEPGTGGSAGGAGEGGEAGAP